MAPRFKRLASAACAALLLMGCDPVDLDLSGRDGAQDDPKPISSCERAGHFCFDRRELLLNSGFVACPSLTVEIDEPCEAAAEVPTALCCGEACPPGGCPTPSPPEPPPLPDCERAGGFCVRPRLDGGEPCPSSLTPTRDACTAEASDLICCR